MPTVSTHRARPQAPWGLILEDDLSGICDTFEESLVDILRLLELSGPSTDSGGWLAVEDLKC